MRFITSPILATALLGLSFAWADVVYVHSTQARILSTPAFNADVLSTVEQGSELLLLEQNKRWVKIQFQETQGWVSTLLVKSEPPIEKVRVIGSEDLTIEGTTRRRASEVATAGATRGLNDSEDATSTGLLSDYPALFEMESIDIEANEIDSFAEKITGGAM
jgi:hypothetical protein